MIITINENNNIMDFFGVDVSKDTLDFCKAGQKKVKKAANEPAGWQQLADAVTPDSWVVMEATGPYFLGLAIFLTDRDIKVSVVNPLMIKNYCKAKMSRVKTDQVDARLIADYALKMHADLQVWKPRPVNTRSIRQLNTVREMLLKQINQVENQNHAFSLDEQACEAALRINNQSLTFMRDSLKKVERKLDELAKEEYGDLIKRISTIPGVGRATAILLCVLTDGFTRFESHQQLSTYIGIAPSPYQSGTSVKGKGHISKMGAGYVRKQLYMCAYSASRYNPACGNLYKRLRSKGKPHKVAQIAVAHKLVRQVFEVAMTNSVYDEKKALAA